MLTWILTSVLIATGAVLTAGTFATTIARRSAARRSITWTVCFCVIGAGMVYAAWPVPFPAPPAEAFRDLSPLVTAIPTVASVPQVAATLSLQDDPPSQGLNTHLAALEEITAVVWTLGAIFFASRLGRRHLALFYLKRGSRPVPVALQQMLAVCQEIIGVRRAIDLRLASSAGTIGTAGLLRPVIFLPPEASEWPNGRVRRVLLHEVAHVAHADWTSRLAVDLMTALLWCHPLVWLAAGQVRREQEAAADDAVLRSEERVRYATDLVDLATRETSHYSKGERHDS